MPKDMRLDENAEIYKKREEQSEKDKLKDMNFRKKVEYICEYYKIHGLVIAAVLALIIYILYSILNPGPVTVFEAAIIDTPMNEEVWEEYGNSFADQLGLDAENHVVSLNTNYSFNTSIDYSVSMRQVLMARLSAGEIDVIIAPESEFKSYAQMEYFKDLAEQVPTDIYSKITNQLYLTPIVDGNGDSIDENGNVVDTEGNIINDNPEINAYGIYLNDTELFKNNSYSQDPYILGIVANSDNNDTTIDFIRYLLQMYP